MVGKIDSGIVAAPFREEVRDKVAALKKKGITAPLLVGILANNDPAARKYAEWTGRACEKDGLRYELRVVKDSIDVESVLMDANEDPRVHGIIVYYPIFGQTESFSGASQDDYLRDTVSYKCDVEGLCHTYRTNLYRNIRFMDPPNNTRKCIIPCTALSVVKILEQCPGCYDSLLPVGRKLEGKVVTIINRSEIVGRPLAAMLANDGAEVYSIDIESVVRFSGNKLHMCADDVTPESCVKKSSIVITGVPVKTYKLNVDWIQPGSTVVNVSSFKNVDEESLLKVPNLTYVPMVGKVTVAMLERNLIRLFENYHHPDSQPYLDHRDASSGGRKKIPWYGNPIQLYTAAVVTAIAVMSFVRNAKK